MAGVRVEGLYVCPRVCRCVLLQVPCEQHYGAGARYGLLCETCGWQGLSVRMTNAPVGQAPWTRALCIRCFIRNVLTGCRGCTGGTAGSTIMLRCEVQGLTTRALHVQWIRMAHAIHPNKPWPYR